MKTILKPFLLGTLSTIILFSSCKKEEDTSTDTNPTVLECDYFENEPRKLTDDPNKPVDYEVTCNMFILHKLTIEPGVVIQFRDNAGFVVDQSVNQGNAIGILNAEATESKPIVFTGKNKVNGAWNGIIFYTNSTENKLAHCEIEYGGGEAFNSNGDRGNVIIYANSKVSISNCYISNSGSYGINSNYSAEFSLNNTTITACNETPVLTTISHIGKYNATCSYNGNTKDYIRLELNTDALNENTTIQRLNVPFRVFANSATQHITIANGITTINDDVTIEFSNGTGIEVWENGTLHVNSTGSGVTFTGISKSAGAWAGIYYIFTQGNNQLNNVTIEYAGSMHDNQNFGIGMWASPKLSVSNVTFKNIDGCAIYDYLTSGSNPNFSDLGGNSYLGNTGNDYCNR